MIIVSQDEKQMINFDNVTRIFIEDFSEDGDGFGIGADTNSAESQCWDLGYYKTEERAKEVLQKIIKTYQFSESYRYCETLEAKYKLIKELECRGIDLFAYEMPKE